MDSEAEIDSLKQVNETKSLSSILKREHHKYAGDFIYNEEMDEYLSEDDSDYNPSGHRGLKKLLMIQN